MVERPILFNAEMVCAILDGRKSQTRRVIKPQPAEWYWIDSRVTMKWGNTIYNPNLGEPRIKMLCHCPYGVPGDWLWVRETWLRCLDCGAINYHATTGSACQACDSENIGRKKPSIHMPRWMSRIMLEIKTVRVERVQEISCLDIEAEGIPYHPNPQQLSYRNDNYQRLRDFRYVWDCLNATSGYGWDVNPWVWVVEFAT